MNFERQLRVDYEDRKKSLEFYFSNNIEKSVISDLSYQTDLNQVSIKGTEIKDKLLVQKGITIESITACIEKIQSLHKEIGIDPQELDEYTKGMKKYSYSQIYPQTSDNVLEPPINEPCNKMREYNNHVWKLSSLRKDLDSVRLMVSNIKENKEYKLPIHVASQLGF